MLLSINWDPTVSFPGTMDFVAIAVRETSIKTPASHTEFPATLWPPARTAMSKCCNLAKFTAHVLRVGAIDHRGRSRLTPRSSVAGLWAAPSTGIRSSARRKSRSRLRALDRAFASTPGGIIGPTMAHSLSVKSLGNAGPAVRGAAMIGWPHEALLRESGAQQAITSDSSDSRTSRIGSKVRRCDGRRRRAASARPGLSRQSPKSLLRMLPPLAQSTSTTPISEPPATTPEATGKVNSSASFGFRFSSRSATRAPRKNKSP